MRRAIGKDGADGIDDIALVESFMSESSSKSDRQSHVGKLSPGHLYVVHGATRHGDFSSTRFVTMVRAINEPCKILPSHHMYTVDAIPLLSFMLSSHHYDSLTSSS